MDLPPELRTAMLGKLVTESPSDPIADRVIRSMTNADLSRALVELGEGSDDAVALAERLARTGVRMPDIVDLTAALRAGHVDASTIVAGIEQIGTPAADVHPGSVTEALGAYLVATAPDDVRSLQWLADSEREQATSVGIATLQDYLSLENDRHQFDQVAQVWVDATCEALRSRSDRRIRELLAAVEGIVVPGDGRAFSTVFAPAVLRPDVVRTLVRESAAPGAPSTSQLLEPFGGPALTTLFDQLADEDDRGHRAALLGILRSLAPGRSGAVIDRLRDPRWYVVRNAVNVVRHSGDPGTLDLLAEAAQHSAEAVRREAVWGLLAGGPAALPHLVAAASSTDASVRRLTVEALGSMQTSEAAGALAKIVVARGDLVTRRLALERLGTNRTREASEHLHGLGMRRAPRVPRSLRRRARALARAWRPS
jgi:hypothetical protein